jgi:hypothetical protein
MNIVARYLIILSGLAVATFSLATNGIAVEQPSEDRQPPDPHAVDAFLASYMTAHQSLQASFTDCTIESELKFENGIRHQFRYAALGERVRLDEFHFPPDAKRPNVHAVRIYDGKQLVYAVEKQDGSYEVLNIQKGDSKLLLTSFASECPAPYAAFCHLEKPLTEIFQGKHFQIISISDRGDSIAVEWSDKVASSDATLQPMWGTYVFDPKNHMALVEIRCRYEEHDPSAEMIRRIQYDASGAIEAVTLEGVYPQEGRSRIASQAQGIKTIRKPPDVTLFTLSSLGLPENLGVPAVPRRDDRLWWILIINGVVLIALGATWLRRRRATRQGPSPSE